MWSVIAWRRLISVSVASLAASLRKPRPRSVLPIPIGEIIPLRPVLRPLLTPLIESGPLHEGLRLVSRGGRKAGLRLLPRLLIRKIWLREPLDGRGEAIGDDVVFVVAVFGLDLARRAGEPELSLLLRQLRRRDDAEVMLGVLKVAFRHDRVARRLRIPGELKIFLGYVMSGPSNFNIRSVRLVGAGQRVRTLAVVTTAHALILTWSHRLSLSETFPDSCVAGLSGKSPPPRFRAEVASTARSAKLIPSSPANDDFQPQPARGTLRPAN